MDLEHILESFVDIEFGVKLRVKEFHKPEVAFNINAIHSSIIYTDLIEYKIVGNTMTLMTSLLGCFPFVWKPEVRDPITTGQYMNYQTFGNLQFRPLLKCSVHIIHINLRNTSGENIPFVSVDNTRFVLMFRMFSIIHF